MSHFEENEDIGHDPEAEIAARENAWKGGQHTTSAGKTIALGEMATPHLINTINKFKDSHNVSALESELKRRESEKE